MKRTKESEVVGHLPRFLFFHLVKVSKKNFGVFAHDGSISTRKTKYGICGFTDSTWKELLLMPLSCMCLNDRHGNKHSTAVVVVVIAVPLITAQYFSHNKASHYIMWQLV